MVGRESSPDLQFGTLPSRFPGLLGFAPLSTDRKRTVGDQHLETQIEDSGGMRAQVL